MSDKKRYKIDRIENDIAVCENDEGSFEYISLFKLPEGTKEGQVIYFKDGEYVYAPEETEALKNEFFKLQNELFEDAQH